MVIEYELPEPFDTIQERVSARDREYFEGHPTADSYVRPYVPGEAWLLQQQDPEGAALIAFVEVTQLGPGVRTRRFILGPDGSE